jgi:hypothetical protein
MARPTSRRRTKAVLLLVPVIGVTLVFWRIQEGINLVIPEVTRAGISKCSKQQLKAINTALPDLDHHCSDDKYPWLNKCPISKITGCPNRHGWISSINRTIEGQDSSPLTLVAIRDLMQ